MGGGRENFIDRSYQVFGNDPEYLNGELLVMGLFCIEAGKVFGVKMLPFDKIGRWRGYEIERRSEVIRALITENGVTEEYRWKMAI